MTNFIAKTDINHDEPFSRLIVLVGRLSIYLMDKAGLGNIIVSIDFSDQAIRSLKYALKIAEITNAKLWILHVYRLINPPQDQLNQEGIELKNLLEEYNLERFHQLESELLFNSGIAFEFLLEIGFASNVITSVIKSHNIDLAVMSYGGEGNQFMGSTTSNLLEQQHIPTIMVPPQTNQFEKINRITFLNDCKINKRDQQLGFLIYITKKLNAKLDMFDPEELKASTYWKQRENNPENCILEYLKEHEADLFCVLKKECQFYERLLNESLRREMLLHSKVPLLILNQ